MLRIREHNGSFKQLESGQFVEICDLEGSVAVLIYKDEEQNIHTVKASDPEAKKYAEIFGVKFVQLVKINI